MFLKLFTQEFKRHKVINITLAIFIIISAMLLSSATYISLVLNKGINELTSKGMTPHYIQMHAGEVDEQALENFNATLDYIEHYQLQEMITITPNTIFIKDATHSEVNGVMDMSFVTQNENFDFLLNTDNEVASVDSSEIGVPVYYKAKYDLQLGDVIQLQLDDEVYQYQISVFTRDSQMNSSLISSKRFLLSESDFTILQSKIIEREYMIEYIFTSTDKVSEFKNTYQEANLPDSGPAVGYRLFRLMNALTDGIVILILLLISASLTIIGLLCLRYSLLSNIEEDIKQIGILKAIGITNKDIKKIYFRKFVFLTSISITIGYFLSFFTNTLFMSNIEQYMGRVALSTFTKIIPVLGALMVMGVVLLTVRRILRKIEKISVVETITNQNVLQKKDKKQIKSIKKRRGVPIPVTLGVNSLRQNKKSYRLMVFIFVVAVVMMVLPLNVYKTFGASDFIEYMGVGYSDLRLDIRNTEDSTVSDSIIEYLNADEDIKEYAVYKTYTMKAYNNDDEVENLFVEIGDYTKFQLQYLEGHAPILEREIAFSTLAMQSLDKEVGDQVRVIRDDGIVVYDIVGVYQDITNGGKTAKAVSSDFEEDLLWNVVSVNLTDGSDVASIRNEYSTEFQDIKVTGIQEYLTQTLGDTIEQLRVVAIAAITISIIIIILITALFLNMLLVKETHQIAVMKSIGINNLQIGFMYITRIIVVLLIGIFIGILITSVIGDDMVSVISRAFGASRLILKQDRLFTWILVPSMSIIVGIITSSIVIYQNKLSSISRYLNI